VIVRFAGRSDFIDNESLDFGNFEVLMQTGNVGQQQQHTPASSAPSADNNHQSRLPETPPDSSGGSEPPYSPRDMNPLPEQSRLSDTLNLSLAHQHQHSQLSITTSSLEGGQLSTTSPIYLNSVTHPKQCNNELISSVAEHMLLPGSSTLLELGGHDRRVYGSNELVNLGLGGHQGDIQTITADDIQRLISSDQLYTQHILATGGGAAGGHLHMPGLAMNPQLFVADPLSYHHQHDPNHGQETLQTAECHNGEPATSTASSAPSSGKKRKIVAPNNDPMEWAATASIVKPESETASSDSEIVLCCTSSINLPTFTGNAQQFQEQMESQTDGTLQCIRFSSFQKHQWHILCDQNLHEL
jgi:hypothetical protein